MKLSLEFKAFDIELVTFFDVIVSKFTSELELILLIESDPVVPMVYVFPDPV